MKFPKECETSKECEIEMLTFGIQTEEKVWFNLLPKKSNSCSLTATVAHGRPFPIPDTRVKLVFDRQGTVEKEKYIKRTSGPFQRSHVKGASMGIRHITETNGPCIIMLLTWLWYHQINRAAWRNGNHKSKEER